MFKNRLEWLLIILPLLVFAPSLGNSFINWDDDQEILLNPAIRELSLPNLKIIFNLNPHKLSMSLRMLSHALEYHCFGLNPSVYIFNNILLHSANTVLVFILLTFLFERRRALLAALLFSLSPLRAESVVWISERKDVLYAFFYLGGLILYGRYLLTPSLSFDTYKRKIPLVGAVAAFACALLSKAQGLSFPLAAWLARAHLKKKDSPSKFLLAMLLLLAAGSFYFPFGQAIWLYAFKIFIPAKLAGLYPPLIAQTHAPLAQAASVAALLAAGGILLWSRQRALIFGFLFFLIHLLLPLALSAGLFPLLREDRAYFTPLIADRFSYLASVGLYLMAADIFFKFLDDARISPWPKKTAIAGVCLTLALFSVMTMRRCGVWKNSFTFWNDVLRNYPDVPRAWHNRGLFFDTAKRYDLAIKDFTQAITLYPNFTSAYYNRGNAYAKSGQYAAAFADYQNALLLQPRNPDIYAARGNAYCSAKKYDEAFADYRRALTIDARNGSARANLDACQALAKGQPSFIPQP